MKVCNHPRCDDDECRALTPEELTPDADDLALADQLHAEGWIQTSAKHRHIRRWKRQPPAAIYMLSETLRNTAWGRRAVLAIERWVTSSGALHSEYPNYDVTLYDAAGPPRKAPPGEVGCYELADEVDPNPLIEERTLTVRQFKAFKQRERERDNRRTR